MAEIAQEIRFDVGAGEELAIDAGIVEAGHRSGVEAERPRSHDQIGALQRAVAESGVEDLRLVAFEPASGIGVGKEIGQVKIEIEVVADDGADRRLHGLVAVAFGEMRLETLLGLARFDEQETGRGAICRGRAELQEIDKLGQSRVGHLSYEGVVRPGVSEQLVQAGCGKLAAQTGRTSCTSGMKCLSRFSIPWRSVAVELGQPEQAPRICRNTTPSR